MEATHQAMRDVDVFISPSSPVLLLTNLTGHPQVALPAGFTQRGGQDVPVTMTFVGQLFGEAEMLTVARAWQEATGHHLRTPPAFS
jgi:Asp-tRNA(Asn)/Glu-tRNA(Gln) amidotransferase A subunit family amidase